MWFIFTAEGYVDEFSSLFGYNWSAEGFLHRRHRERRGALHENILSRNGRENFL